MLNAITKKLIAGNITASIKAANAAIRQSTDETETELLNNAIASLTDALDNINKIKSN